MDAAFETHDPQRPGETSTAPGTALSSTGRQPKAPFRHAWVIVNPIAGRGRGQSVAEEVCRGLANRGVRGELHVTRGAGDARAHLATMPPSVDLVVSVGGDGTLAEVMSGLPNPELPIGILPLGTANVLGLDLGLPRDVDRALEIIARAKAEPIDICQVNGRLSFLATGVGLDSLVVRRLEKLRTGPISKGTWVRAALGVLPGYRVPELEVSLDGKPLPGTWGWVLVSNVVHYAGVFRLDDGCRRDDGQYEVYLFRKAKKRHLPGILLRLLFGRLPGGACELHRAREVKIESRGAPVPVQVDGDLHGETPVDLEVSSTRHRILVP